MIDIATLAAFWGTPTAPPRLIAQRENTIYAAAFTDGRRAALRLHRPGYRSRDEVLSELTWTQALAAQDFPCPAPLRGADGTFLPQTGPLVSAITWLDGTAPSEQTAHTPDHAFALGALLGRLHRAADKLDQPRPPGPGWTVDTLLGDAPRLGRFWESPALTPHGRALLSEARLALAATLPDMPGAAVGLIHADPLRENLLQTGAGLALIDFDDCAAGMRGHDLGSALIQTAEAPGASERAAALAEGYGISSGPLPAFTLLRALASCGWAVSRLPADDPRIAAYAGRAERLAKAWLG